MGMDLKYTLYIDAAPEKVWDVLVSKEGVKAIFFGCELRTSLMAGDNYEYVGPGAEGDETVHVYGKILECEPAKLLRMSEHPGPSYNSQHAELETQITYTLETVGSVTKLTLLNDQWPEQHPSYANTSEHWPMILSNIKTFTESGKTLDFGW